MCRGIERDLWDYAGDRLSEGPLERVERHLQQCASCAQEVEGMRRAQSGLKELCQEVIPPPATGWEAIARRLEHEPTPVLERRIFARCERRVFAGDWLPSMAAASVVSLLMLVGAFGYRSLQSDPAPTTQSPASRAALSSSSAPSQETTAMQDTTESEPSPDDLLKSPLREPPVSRPSDVASAPSVPMRMVRGTAPTSMRKATPSSSFVKRSGNTAQMAARPAAASKRRSQTPVDNSIHFEPHVPTDEERDALNNRVRTPRRTVMGTLVPVSQESDSDTIY
jgi:hypothetical protein